MKKFPFTSILGWSSSRYDVFSTCKRKYYYRYYAKHDTDFALDQISRLKQLTTVPLTVGSIAHDVIETLLKRLQKSDADIDTSRLKGAYCQNGGRHHSKIRVFRNLLSKARRAR